MEGRYSGANYEDVKRKWEATKLYFQDYKKDCTRPPSIDLAMALHGFSIDGETGMMTTLWDINYIHD